MGRETTTQDDQNPALKLEQSPRKQLGNVSGSGGGGDRLKRDEWSEGAVTILLEAYESKWILRNRAKLKGQDWEDVAKCVSSRESSSKSPKTQTQCKNKIESMKKRYRSESATSETSSWPLFSRLDHLLRGTGTVGSILGSVPALLPAVKSPPIQTLLLPPLAAHVPEPSPVAQAQPPLLPQHPPVAVLVPHYSQESNDVAPMVKENDEMTAKSSDKVAVNNNLDNHHVETDSSTPAALYSNDDDEPRNKKTTMTRKRRRRDNSSCWDEVAESIRLLADAIVRSEQARMDTMKEVERIRVEAEAKRSEMDLKRTEIIANTQLEMARIFASVAGKNVDSSLKIGRTDL